MMVVCNGVIQQWWWLWWDNKIEINHGSAVVIFIKLLSLSADLLPACLWS